MTILFYTSIPRLFRATSIAHLYEIAQTHTVILLAEELDKETEKLLANKSMFPKLKQTIPVRQFTGSFPNIFARNKNCYKIAQYVTKKYQPDCIIGCDMYLFELYLMRLASKYSTLNIGLQGSLQIPMKEASKYTLLTEAYSRFPLFIPLWIKIAHKKNKKYLAHVFYYWILPLSVGEPPFTGASSMVLLKGSTGMRSNGYYIVMSPKNYYITKSDGLSEKQIYILPHPLARGVRSFLMQAYGLDNKPSLFQTYKKTVCIMYPEIDIAFKREYYTIIPQQKIYQTRQNIIMMIHKILPEWQIMLKPHPAVKNLIRIKKLFEPLGSSIKVINPQEPADTYIAKSEVIIGFPPASTTLYTSSLQCPEKIILSIDLQKELYGDVYANSPGIDYIDDIDKLQKTLVKIRDHTYFKFKKQEKNELTSITFNNTIELLNHLKSKKS